MGVIVRCENAVFHERTYAYLSERFTQWLAVVAFVRGEGLQLARVPASELRTYLCVTSLSSGRIMNVKNRLRVRIDEFRRFDRLNAVVRTVAVVLIAGDRL